MAPESDVYKHQIMTCKVGPRTERVNVSPPSATLAQHSFCNNSALVRRRVLARDEPNRSNPTLFDPGYHFTIALNQHEYFYYDLGHISRPFLDILPILTYHDMPPVNPFKPEFTIVIFLNYKPRIAIAILDL